MYGTIIALSGVWVLLCWTMAYRAEAQPDPYDACAVKAYPEGHPGTIFKLPFDHLDWIETGEGLRCLPAHNTKVALWWPSWYDQGAEERVEKPWGDEIYRFRPDERERISRAVHALRSIGVKSIVYVHTWNLKSAGYNIGQILAWADDMKTWWGMEGIYLDGVFYGNELETQRLFKGLRVVFPAGEGVIYLHDSNSSRAELGHPRAIELVDYCLVGEWKTTPWSDEELDYKLLDPGPSQSFVLKIHDNPKTPGPDVPEDEQQRLMCWCAEHGVSLGWSKGQLYKNVRWYEECVPAG